MLLVTSLVSANAQSVNNGGTLQVGPGGKVVCAGSIFNKPGGVINNQGLVSSQASLVNDSAGMLSGNGGFYEVAGNFVNQGLSFQQLRLRLIGSTNTDSVYAGSGSTFDSLVLAKNPGAGVFLADNISITGGMAFPLDGNRLVLGSRNLSMGPAAGFSNPGPTRFVMTNGTGQVIKQDVANTGFLFPIGYAVSEYNPLLLANAGQPDHFSVRALEHALANGWNGNSWSSGFTNNSWIVTEANPGGSELTLTAGWSNSDEPNGFNRAKSGIAQYVNNGWDMPASDIAGASEAGLNYRTRSNLASAGVFAIADLSQVNSASLNLRVFLQGAYSGNGMMNDGLRVSNVIPLVQPYNASMSAGFVRTGVYDGTATVNEQVPSSAVFDQPGTADDIVDWIYVALLDAQNPSTKLQTRAALLQRDGDVVEYDPVSASLIPLKMPINQNGDYWVSIGHRNHLAVRTGQLLNLRKNEICQYDLSTAQGKAFNNPAITTNAAMKDLSGNATVFGLWGGNANANNSTRASGGNAGLNDFLYLVNIALGGNNTVIFGPPMSAAVYHNADLNMNGVVRASGGQAGVNDFLFLVNMVLGGNNTLILNAHL